MEDIVYPQYGGTSLLNISSTILSLFGVKPLKPLLPQEYYQKALDAEKVILFLVDGLGNELFQKEALKHTFFKNLAGKGFYSPLTTVFPSTTAAAVSSLYSGLTPFEHGLPEWYVYFPDLDVVLESLPFKPVDQKDYDKTIDPPEDILFNNKTIFEYLKEVGVVSFSLLSKGTVDSLYTRSSCKGSTIAGYEGVEDMVNLLVKLISETKGKAFFNVYYPSIDTAEHQFGVWTKQVELELTKLANVLQTDFAEKMGDNLASKIAIFLTSDHGQLTINLDKTIYLDEIEHLVECLKISRNGKTIPPTSGTRNAFLNIKEEKLDFVMQFLKKELKGKAIVMKMDSAFEEHLFGDRDNNSRFIDRTGNLLLIAVSDYTLGYHYTSDFELKLIGRHGGLSASEMLIPFVCARLDNLRSDP